MIHEYWLNVKGGYEKKVQDGLACKMGASLLLEGTVLDSLPEEYFWYFLSFTHEECRITLSGLRE